MHDIRKWQRAVQKILAAIKKNKQDIPQNPKMGVILIRLVWLRWKMFRKNVSHKARCQNCSQGLSAIFDLYLDPQLKMIAEFIAVLFPMSVHFMGNKSRQNLSLDLNPSIWNSSIF